MLHNPAHHPLVHLVPRPASLTLVPGECVLPEGVEVEAVTGLAFEAEYLAERLRSATGWKVPVAGAVGGVADKPTFASPEHERRGVSGRFVIRLALRGSDETGEADLGGEGYVLTSMSFGVDIRGGGAAGVFYGVQTLLQLLPPAVFGDCPRIDIAWKLPKVTVRDRPRFGWRGAMLDCARHFFPAEEVKVFIDRMALHKLNVFHWHLTDDQGWRLEIKRHPRLTEVGAWRRETMRGHAAARLSGDGMAHGGFYTQAEVREIVAYAAARHIVIVPEIDMPGHARAAIAAYPELGSGGVPVEVWTEWGVTDEILKPGPETFRFCRDVLTEVMELFPGDYIHIGGDEADKTQWMASAEVQRIMREAGVGDPEELQRRFVFQIKEFVESKGRRLIGWDEILEGGPVPGATIMGWRGWLGAGPKAARSGHRVVMTPSAFTYLNHYQAEDIENEPISIGGRFISLEMAHGFEPTADLDEEEAGRVLGVQAALWTEYINNRALLEYMAFPRLCAIAEVAWTPRELRDYGAFKAAMRRHLRRLAILGINHRGLD